MADSAHTTRRRPLTQKPAAFALGIGLLAVPLAPMAADAILPQRDWSADADDLTPLSVVTENGESVDIDALDGWQVTDHGSSVTMRDEGTLVLIDAYDRQDRDPAAVAQRLMRANRLAGISAALDGGTISARDGSALSGDTCVAVTTSSAGTCAFLYDNDVVVSVIAFTDPDSQGPDIETIAGLITRETQQ